MEAIFSLPYSEYQSIEALREYLPKTEGFGIFVAASRQQLGVDFVVLHRERALRVQVKSSRHFEWTRSPTLRFWYRNFGGSYTPGTADIYLLFGLYPAFAKGRNVRDSRAHWRNIILVFSDAEMRRVLRHGGHFFQLGIDRVGPRSQPKVTGTLGGVKGRDLSGHLLDNRAVWLRRQFRKR